MKQHLLNGIGRKVFIRYEKHIDDSDYEIIFDFLIEKCFMQEG